MKTDGNIALPIFVSAHLSGTGNEIGKPENEYGNENHQRQTRSGYQTDTLRKRTFFTS
jgi:hypothetical protein